jgi:Rrf2 family iron-sulfur cluster assembly transcriptional regulator
LQPTGVVVELNTKGRYAVMAMADLAKHEVDTAVPLSQIAERQQLSLSYLEQIFLRLRRAGLVESARGRTGGYRLGRPANEIKVGEIMAAVEEETRMTRCMDGGIGCLGEERCLTHNLWKGLGGHIAAFLWNVTLAEVLSGIPSDKLARGGADARGIAWAAE